MRKIEQDVLPLFINKLPAKCGNTVSDGTNLTLFGNAIAKWSHQGMLFINHCGYETRTTQSRLNALLGLVGYPYKVRTCKGSFRLTSKYGTDQEFEKGWILVAKGL